MTRKSAIIFVAAYTLMVLAGTLLLGAEKPALKLRMLPDGRMEIMPDLPTGTSYKLVDRQPTDSGKTWATWAWIINGQLDGGNYLLPFPMDGQPGPVPPEPKPDPKPDPKPQPMPVPDAKVVSVVLVHESGDSDPKAAAVRDAKAWKDALDSKAIRWIISDDDSLVAKLPNVTAKARTQGLPAVVVQFADGTAVAKAAPGTPEAMLELAKGLK